LFLLTMWWLGPGHALSGEQTAFMSLAERSRALIAALDVDTLADAGDGERVIPGANLRIRQCDSYPYGQPATTPGDRGASILIADLGQGLATGLACLTGSGPMGRLHRFHEYQAHRLLSLFESKQAKTMQCVEDAMFATAVATSPRGISPDDALYQQLRTVQHPGIVFDTYRLGGILSRRYDDDTYRAFFHLADAQILEHRNGQPLRPADLHRYKNRPGLIFHEVIHWLGHEHSALYPDLTALYEACCFGGSDYIRDPERNRQHQQTACAILKDDALWSSAHKPYRQMRLWHLKGYDNFKAEMRADYES
jgi:hypothetical protein